MQQAQSVVSYEQEYKHLQLPVELEEQTTQDKVVDHSKTDTLDANMPIGEIKTPASAQEIYDPEDAKVIVEAHRGTQEEISTDQAAEENAIISQLEGEILTEQPKVQFDKNILQEGEPYTATMTDVKTVAEFSAGIVPHENTPVTSATELQELLDALPGVESGELHLVADEESSEIISTERVQEKVQAETEFIGQLAQYIQSLPENPERPQAEQPIAILAEIVRTAQEIHTVQHENLETVNPEAEHTALQEKTRELQQLCTKLFKELGIEADEETVARITNALVAYAAASKKVEQSPDTMSIEELAQQGTHEYKLASWFNQFFSYSKPLPHLVGTAALRLSKLSTSI